MKQIEVVAAMIHKHENNMKQYFRHCFDMKVQMWRPFVVMALWGLIITACTDSSDNPDNPGLSCWCHWRVEARSQKIKVLGKPYRLPNTFL